MGQVASTCYDIVALTAHTIFSGHTRPLINLATRLVRMKPCTVTLLVTDKYLEQAQAEVVRNSTADGQAYDEYVR